MKYRIEISSVAEAEADSAFLRLSQVISPAKASYTSVMHHSKRLAKNPKKPTQPNKSMKRIVEISVRMQRLLAAAYLGR
jgi:hypothetical protein